MSSPVHLPKDLDAALIYAPPWIRRSRHAAPARPARPATLMDETPKIIAAEDSGPTFIGDLAMLELGRQLARDPERVPEPPLPLDDAPLLGRIGLRLGVVASVAALAAWAMISFSSSRPAVDEVLPASIVPPVAAQPVRLVPVRLATVAPALVDDGSTAETGLAPRADRLTVQPVNLGRPATASGPTVGQSEIAALIQRGRIYLNNGDLASARLLLRRAADGGSAEAALTLGATFDPRVIGGLAAAGAEPDTARARKWYQRAADLGSELAPRQLAGLASAPQ